MSSCLQGRRCQLSVQVHCSHVFFAHSLSAQVSLRHHLMPPPTADDGVSSRPQAGDATQGAHRPAFQFAAGEDRAPADDLRSPGTRRPRPPSSGGETGGSGSGSAERGRKRMRGGLVSSMINRLNPLKRSPRKADSRPATAGSGGGGSEAGALPAGTASAPSSPPRDTFRFSVGLEGRHLHRLRTADAIAAAVAAAPSLPRSPACSPQRAGSGSQPAGYAPAYALQRAGSGGGGLPSSAAAPGATTAPVYSPKPGVNVKGAIAAIQERLRQAPPGGSKGKLVDSTNAEHGASGAGYPYAADTGTVAGGAAGGGKFRGATWAKRSQENAGGQPQEQPQKAAVMPASPPPKSPAKSPKASPVKRLAAQLRLFVM